MEDTLLIDAAERFAKGEMSAEEKVYFEDLRKNNPELDQAVVEQLFFLNQFDAYSGDKNFRNILGEVENKLIGEKFISRSTPKTGGKIVMLWSKYRRTVAVAASIAGLVSLSIATVISSFNKGEKTNITPLVLKLDKLEKTTATQQTAINQLAEKTNTPVHIDSRIRATGFMLDVNNNYIVTNAHVVKEASHQLVVENNKGDQYYANVVYVNAANDIAIIKITDTSFKRLPSLPYNVRKGGADLGESIYMLGYPKQEIVYGEGYVSAKNGDQMDTVYCQLSIAANKGNSGSPVITKNGDLVGILTSTEENASGVVFAIKSANIYRALDEVRKMKDNENIKITSAPALRGLDRSSQIKKVEDYVFMIKGN